jgi:hypothetical protein
MAMGLRIRRQREAHDPREGSKRASSLARDRHGDARKLLATGIDPMAQRKADKIAERVANENSFASVSSRWLEHWQEGKSLFGNLY